MPVKRTRNGGWFFRATVKRPDGTRERISGTPGVPGPYHDLPRTKVGAIAAERRAISESLHGKPIARPTAIKEVKTIREHAVAFLATYMPGSKPSEKRSKKQILDTHLLPYFGDMTIDELDQPTVDGFVNVELRRCSPKTVNNRLAVLSTLIKYVTGDRSKLRFKIGGLDGELHAVVTADVEKLLAAAATDLRHRAVVLLASEAGLRAGEIRGLQWTDVRDGQLTVRRALDNKTNEVIAPKHDKLRTVPLSPRLVAALAALPRRGLWVVSRSDGGALGYYALYDAVVALYDRAGVARPPKPIHALRHTFGTVMARRVPLGVLQKLMGHVEISTTMRYIDTSEDDKRDAIATVFGVAATRQPLPEVTRK